MSADSENSQMLNVIYISCCVNMEILFLILFITGCNGAVHHINDTEYIRMPPLFKLDEYDSCLIRDDGTYCMLRLDLVSDASNDLMNLIHEYSEQSVKRFDHACLERGICVPTTCQNFISGGTVNVENAKLHSTLETCLNESISKDYGIHSKLSTVYYCDRHNQAMEYDYYDWMVVAMVIVVIILNIVGTKRDLRNTDDKKEVTEGMGGTFLVCFSLIRNWKWLITVELQEKRMEQLRGIHFLKCLLTFLVLMAHSTWTNITFIDNPQDFEKAYDTFYYQVIHGGMMLVQAFFVLSSFNLVYYLLIISENVEIKWHMYPWIVLQRFFRLTPVYAILLAFTATWLRHLGTGPMWNLLVAGSVTAQCRQHWWKHILYIHNYDYEDKFCAIQSWYLAADFQLFLLGVAIFVSAKRMNKSLVMFSLLLLGIFLPALQVWLNDLDGVVIMRPEFFRTHINDTYRLLHVRTHSNLSCYIIGMWTAYLVYDLQKKKIFFLNNCILRNLCWLVVPVTACLFASCSVFYSGTERASITLRMAFASLHRIVMAGLTAFTVVALIFRFNRKISTVCEWSGWVVLSKLSYCVYLLHLNFIHIYLGVRTQLSHMSMYNLLIITLGVTFLSIIAALPLYLMVEAPFNRLAKLQVSKTVKMADNKTK